MPVKEFNRSASGATEELSVYADGRVKTVIVRASGAYESIEYNPSTGITTTYSQSPSGYINLGDSEKIYEPHRRYIKTKKKPVAVAAPEPEPEPEPEIPNIAINQTRMQKLTTPIRVIFGNEVSIHLPTILVGIAMGSRGSLWGEVFDDTWFILFSVQIFMITLACFGIDWRGLYRKPIKYYKKKAHQIAIEDSARSAQGGDLTIK